MNQVSQQIEQIRARMGKDLVILTHHYQRDEVVAHGDFVGDSLALAREASRSPAKNIVFCGVYFMAETARILAGNQQKVFLPDMRAGCPMADMADVADAEKAYRRIVALVAPRKVVPVTYVNSNADLKAFVGSYGGIVCTSANAGKVFEWARTKGDVIFFLPDEMLGTNVARSQGLDSIVAYDPLTPEATLDQDLAWADVVVWKGYCHVHTHFLPDDVRRMRETHPGSRIIVHPECRPEVVELADASGSTTEIAQLVADGEPGSTIAVGTEINLVKRLARQNPDRTVLPLRHSLCPNMYRITEPKLLEVLSTFDARFEVTVDPRVKEAASLALERMLEL